MDNLFITQYFDWNRPPSRKVQWANRLLSMLRFRARLVPPRATGEQTSVEQRINLYHLACQVAVCGVPGAFVEIGSHQGSTAVLLQEVLKSQEPPHQLHIFDAFFNSSREQLLATFHELGLIPPVVHVGMVQDTIPSELPDQIAFAHLDVGWRQAFAEHRDILIRCLQGLYPRMAPGAICVIADYCDPDVYVRHHFTAPPEVVASDQWHLYPAVKAACDSFFADKPETITLLYAGPYSHGFFCKQPLPPTP